MSTGGREERKNGDTPALTNFLDQFTQNSFITDRDTIKKIKYGEKI